MNEHVVAQGAETSALMAMWRASGGAVEALAQADAQAASGRQGDPSGDDGLQLQGTSPTHYLTNCGVEDGLEMGRYTRYGDCAGDELRATAPTHLSGGCNFVGDGVQAGAPTGPGCHLF